MLSNGLIADFARAVRADQDRRTRECEIGVDTG